MKNNLHKEIREWLVKNYKGKTKEAIEGIKKEFGVELKPGRIYNLARELKITHKRQIGECVVRKRGGQVERNFIKIGENKWVEKSRYVWEQYNGKIPKGFIIHHINGNALDDRIENLARLSLPIHNYLIAQKLWFDISEREQFLAACLLAELAHIKPHYIRPSRRKGEINGTKLLI